jgi:hypothetical protein
MLDARGVEIAPCKTGVQENPRVAFSGDAFLVVWQDMRGGKDCDVLGARVSPERKVLDEAPISIAAGPRTQAMPDVADDDQSFVVVWHGFQGEETTPRVFAARVGADGAAGEPAAVAEGSSPRIALSGKDYLVTCFDARRSGDRLKTYVKYVCIDAAGKQRFRSTYREDVAYAYSRRISLCGAPGKGWVLVCSRALPDFWGWSGPAAQRAYRITPEGKRAADSPSEQYYDPKRKLHVVPANWLDTSMGQQTHRAAGPAHVPGIWPWGESALAADGQYCVAVWQRYHTGGSTGIDMVNGDVQAGRVHGWKPLDGQGGVAVAAGAADELNPALAGNHTGTLLCVYEKSLGDGTKQICARTMETVSSKRH